MRTQALGGVAGGAGLGAFEYLLMFAAVILAIAVTDIAVSLNRLLEAGRRGFAGIGWR